MTAFAERPAPRTVKPIATDRTVDKSMRARQLASSVRQGRMISFSILDENPVDGYLAGWDADTYFVVYPYDGQVFKKLINRAHVLTFLLYDEGTFREEPFYEEMNKVVRPFRDLINNTYFTEASE